MDALERGEGGVPLVEVCHLGVVTERRERTDAADAENELLLDTRLLVTAIQPRGDLAVVAPILPDVGVEQVQPGPTDQHGPHLANNVATRSEERRVGKE